MIQNTKQTKATNKNSKKYPFFEYFFYNLVSKHGLGPLSRRGRGVAHVLRRWFQPAFRRLPEGEKAARRGGPQRGVPRALPPLERDAAGGEGGRGGGGEFRPGADGRSPSDHAVQAGGTGPRGQGGGQVSDVGGGWGGVPRKKTGAPG